MAEPMKFEELRVLQAAEAVADAIWRQVMKWNPFAREVVGGQLARAADSIGANIAEAFGRFHFGEKLQFLYYARGSLFETKYWLNRTQTRELLPSHQVQEYVTQLTDLARQLNNFGSAMKDQRRGNQSAPRALRETSGEYVITPTPDATLPTALNPIIGPPQAVDRTTDVQAPLFTEDELTWLQTIPNT